MRVQLVLRLARLVIAALVWMVQPAAAVMIGMPAADRATLHKIKAQYGQKQHSRRHGSEETGECGSLSIAPVASTRHAGKTETIVYAENIINAPDCH